MFYTYDIETYPNIFTCTVLRHCDKALWRFEISDRKHQGVEFFKLLTAIRDSGGRMVGFNNIGFDYPVIHEIIKNVGNITVSEIYNLAQSIINASDDDKFKYLIWENERYVPQIDLFKVHHFDNFARSTSLKVLEFNMRSENIQDLPFTPGMPIFDDSDMDRLIEYNDHDVFETDKFLEHSLDAIKFRDKLSAKYGKDFTNHNDTKIGKDYFIMELERSGIKCFKRVIGRKQPVQTVRDRIDLSTVILPKISFNTPEFQRVLDWLKSQVITETKGVFKGVHAIVDGFQYDFGTGGIHGSVPPGIYYSTETHVIESRDVASYYPNLAITNRFYPEHLTERFCDIYKDVYNQRQQHAKGTPENAVMKLALNGVYGDSNSKFSPFYDPAFTMSITVNGQLLLCMLCEKLTEIPSLRMLMLNTDGFEYIVPREFTQRASDICREWELFTGLTLEASEYMQLCIRDCNNYIGVSE